MSGTPENELRMILRDKLALTRTRLANERTFLAYIRTFIGAYASGVGLIKLTNQAFFIYTGYVLVILAPFILVFGIIRHIQVKRRLGIAYILSEEEGIE